VETDKIAVEPAPMPNSLVSIAVLEPYEGHEEELLAVIEDLYNLMEAKGYSRNELLRSRNEPIYYINIRYWTSEQARMDAHEDPEVHRHWARLGQLCHIPRVHEMMDIFDWKNHTIGEPER
jgi:heme-degrading monooxygenase HmoA